MKKLSLCLCASVVLLLTGCLRLESQIKSQDLTLSLPKDASFDALIYRREFIDALGRTNVVTLTITNGSFRNNPLVIDAKTRHDLNMIRAGADAAASVIGAAVK